MSTSDLFINFKRHELVQVQTVHASEHGVHRLRKKLSHLRKFGLSDWSVTLGFNIFHGKSLLKVCLLQKKWVSLRKKTSPVFDHTGEISHLFQVLVLEARYEFC